MKGGTETMGTKAWGYDATNKAWRPILVTAAGVFTSQAARRV